MIYTNNKFYNKFFVIVLFAAAQSVFFCAGNINEQELFLQANQLYTQQNYQEALNVYTSIHNKEHATIYNMGNCAYQLHNYPQAMVYWLRSLRYATPLQYDAVMHNITLTNSIITKKNNTKNDHPVLPIFLQYRLCYIIASYFSLLIFQLLCIICWYTLFLLYKRWIKTTMYTFYLFSVICILIISSVGATIKYQQQYSNLGVVYDNKKKLFIGPDDTHCVLAQLNESDIAIVYEKIHGWYKVKINNNIGWISDDAFEIV